MLVSLQKLSDNSIFQIKENSIEAIAASEDNSIYLWASLKGDWENECSLNLPSLGKLAKLLNMIPSDDVDFILNGNNLEYKDNGLKFKYYLHDDGILTKPKISVEKIKSFNYDVTFEVDPKFLIDLIKKEGIIRSSKLYIYTENGKLVWSLEDKTMTNSDTLTIIGDDCDEDFDQFIIKTDNLKNIVLSTTPVVFRFNTKLGVGNIVSTFGNLILNYVASSLVK